MDDRILMHQSGVSTKGEPFVQLIHDGKVIGQMTPHEARDHGLTMIEAAEAAEQDAFIFDWVKTHVGAGDAQAAGMLADFRKFRMERTGKKGGPFRPDDWVTPET